MNQLPPPARPQFKRRTIFIKKGLQIRYMALIVFSVLTGLAIMAFELTFTLNEVFDKYPVLIQPIYDNFVPIAMGFLYKLALYILFILLISALLSHKMAGPVYRFEQTCKAIAKGDFSQRVHLRQGDQLQELQEDFNAMMDKIEEELKQREREQK